MLSVMSIMVLVMSQDHWTKAGNILGQHVLSSSPLLNRFGKEFWKDYTPSVRMTSIVQLLKVLQWDHVIMFFDQLHRHEIQSVLPMIGLASVHEFRTSAGVRQNLLQLYKTFFPRLHFLLLLNNSMTQDLLQIIDQFDMDSNRTTDFCHFSFWIVVNQGQPQPSDLPLLQHLENVAYISSHETGDEELRQLLTTPEGRAFSPGKPFTDFKVKRDIFPNTRYGLNNRTLIVSTLEDAPFVVTTGKGVGGYCFDIMDAIATYLNFSYKTVHAADMQWGALVDGEWNGLIGQLAKREVDLVVAPITIHEDREKVMDFLYPPIFTKVDDIVYKLQPNEGGRWLIHLRAFASSVLLLLLITLLVSTLTACLLFRYDYATLRQNSSDVKQPQLYYYMSSIAEILIYLYGVLLNRGLQFNPRNQSTRMLLFTWGIFSVIIAACYSSVLVSRFTVQKPQLPFRSLRELVSQKEYKWGFLSGHIRERIIKYSKSDDLKLVWKGVIEFNKTDPEVLGKDHSLHIAKMKAEKYAYIMTRYRMQDIRPYDCNIHNVGQDVIWEQYGIGVPSDYPLTKVLEEALAVIADSGLLDVWWRRHWVREGLDYCDPDKNMDILTLQEFASAFFLLCCGLGAAFVVLMMEIIKHKLQ